MVPFETLMEQLDAVVMHYPVWPGDTLSHAAAKECKRRGWIVRDADGCWIPTARGIRINGEWAAEEEAKSND